MWGEIQWGGEIETGGKLDMKTMLDLGRQLICFIIVFTLGIGSSLVALQNFEAELEKNEIFGSESLLEEGA